MAVLGFFSYTSSSEIVECDEIVLCRKVEPNRRTDSLLNLLRTPYQGLRLLRKCPHHGILMPRTSRIHTHKQSINSRLLPIGVGTMSTYSHCISRGRACLILHDQLVRGKGGRSLTRQSNPRLRRQTSDPLYTRPWLIPRDRIDAQQGRSTVSWHG